MPTIASIKEGDVVFPLTLMDKHLYVLARLPVERREPAIDYTLREQGRPCGALEHGSKAYPKFEYRDSWCPILPYQEHQMPFNCCSKWAVSGARGSGIKPRQLPDELLPGFQNKRIPNLGCGQDDWTCFSLKCCCGITIVVY